MYNIIEPLTIKKFNMCYKQSFSSSYSEYNSFYEWFIKEKNENILDIKKNKLKYLYDVIDDVDKKINTYFFNRKNVNTIMLLSDIEYKNKENFKEFIDDLKFEYNFLTSDEPDKNYNYYSNVMTWFDLTQDYLIEALNNLSKDHVQLKNFEIEIQTVDKELDCEDCYMTFNLEEIEIW